MNEVRNQRCVFSKQALGELDESHFRIEDCDYPGEI